MNKRRCNSEGLEARPICVLFFAVGVAVLLVAVNTPLRLDEGIGAGGRGALYAISAFATAFALGIYVVARYGGEEFVVLLPGTTPEGAAVFYERARADLLERSQKELGFPLRVSAGAVSSGSGKSAEEILAAADGAMYEAKRRGKDRIFIPEA